MLGLSHRTLHSVHGRHADDAQASLTMTRKTLIQIIAQETTFVAEMGSGGIVLEGDAEALLVIFGNLDTFGGGFKIVEP
jgi:alkyl sulfatase BDS1-like metallo-beta-lactamase superfamily hydrolase